MQRRPMNDQLIIFDTTLRDGEQSPGASMTRDEKVRIARQLERMRVDIIEAGFPVASPGDFEAVKAVAAAITESAVCALARAVEKDIDRAAEALRPAKRARIHTFIATSPIHMQNKLRMTPEQVLERAVWAVRHARRYTDDVEFSPEDAGRSEIDFLCRVLEAVIAAGARTVNIPDTVGYNLPHQFGGLIKNPRERVPNSDKAIVGATAFAHESGIHQDGVIKKRETYEIMRAEDVGWSANRMVLGKHSGRSAFKQRLKELRIEFKTEQELNSSFERFKDLADKKHEIFDEDLQALVTEADLEQENEHFRLVSLKVCSQTGETPFANVTLAVNGSEKKAAAPGSGPVDAAFKAIDSVVGSQAQLLLYSVNNITSGTDSQGEVTVRLERGGGAGHGHGAGTPN